MPSWSRDLLVVQMRWPDICAWRSSMLLDPHVVRLLQGAETCAQSSFQPRYDSEQIDARLSILSLAPHPSVYESFLDVQGLVEMIRWSLESCSVDPLAGTKQVEVSNPLATSGFTCSVWSSPACAQAHVNAGHCQTQWQIPPYRAYAVPSWKLVNISLHPPPPPPPLLPPHTHKARHN